MSFLSTNFRLRQHGFSGSLLFVLLSLALMAAGCGGGGGSTSTGGTTPPPPPTTGIVQPVSHVVVIMEENSSFESVIGSSAMPFLNSLATKNGLATNYFANTHPSIGNYFMLTTGTIPTNDDAFAGTVGADNLVRQFAKDGKTWKGYYENLPSVGYLGGDAPLYLKHHNPFSYFTDVISNPTEAAKLVPFTQFATDLAAGTLPNFSFIVPNPRDNAHDCPGGALTCTDAERLAPADAWLQTNIGPLLSNTSAMADTLVVIAFDESVLTDLVNGGGHVPVILISPKAKQGFQGAGSYQHQNLLRTIGNAMQLSSIPGEGATAPPMLEFFP
jgi:phosphatidylinositol-3-phosphatase